MTHPENDRRLIARIAANERWAKADDRSAATQPARAAMARKFEDQVDPDRVLSPEERGKRVENVRRAYYQRLARKSAEARRAKGGAATKPVEDDGD